MSIKLGQNPIRMCFVFTILTPPPLKKKKMKLDLHVWYIFFCKSNVVLTIAIIKHFIY